MSFIFNHNDTIAAIATPLGTGGVGVVRISGKKSLEIISKIFSTAINEHNPPDFNPNRIYHGWIFDTNILIDEVIVLYFKAPHSYTGEDIVEIQGHGGINIIKNILKLCLKSGAGMADKGEFSKRAFMNGKLDLSKAEAVLDLIHSKTDKFSHAAAKNLSGNLSSHINKLRQELLDLLSMVTAAIDFPEEVNEPEYYFIEKKLNYLIEEINRILKNANSSNLMRDGLKVAFAGKPNAGKSSLFNALLDMERSIVTEIPGTTRDIIQESIDIDGIPVTLIDTAGIREINSLNSASQIESIGINLTKNCIENADIVLFVYDLSQGLQNEDMEIFESIKHQKVLKIGTKVDLCCHPERSVPVGIKSLTAYWTDSSVSPQNDSKPLLVSAKEKIGLDLIKNEIKKLVITDDVSHGFCTNIRHQECLIKSKNALLNALNACKNEEIQDLIFIDMKSGLISLGEITGEVVSEEIINNIFENFCIGK